MLHIYRNRSDALRSRAAKPRGKARAPPAPTAVKPAPETLVLPAAFAAPEPKVVAVITAPPLDGVPLPLEAADEPAPPAQETASAPVAEAPTPAGAPVSPEQPDLGIHVIPVSETALAPPPRPKRKPASKPARKPAAKQPARRRVASKPPPVPQPEPEAEPTATEASPAEPQGMDAPSTEPSRHLKDRIVGIFARYKRAKAAPETPAEPSPEPQAPAPVAAEEAPTPGFTDMRAEPNPAWPPRIGKARDLELRL